MAGPLFRELAEDLSRCWSPSLLFTGHPDTVGISSGKHLLIKKAPGYNRRSILTRLFSWLLYFGASVRLMASQKRDTLFFIVSNPPFLGLAGLMFNLLFGHPYIILVYDVYPDVLVNTGRISNGLFAKCWDIFNCFIYKRASLLMTIDNDMAVNLQKKMDRSGLRKKNVIAIAPWADVDMIKPVSKNQNDFVQQYDLNYETTVLYSGNMGHTHRIEPLLDAAKQLECFPGIHFLFIGEGVKYKLVEEFIFKNKLKNITLLPFQPESVLPLSITSGDIGVVAYEQGTQGCILPSKTFYYMAAGLAPLIITDQATELTDLVREQKCGISVSSNDIDKLVQSIKELHQNHKELDELKINARKTAVDYFSRNNTNKFVKALKEIGI